MEDLERLFCDHRNYVTVLPWNPHTFGHDPPHTRCEDCGAIDFVRGSGLPEEETLSREEEFKLRIRMYRSTAALGASMPPFVVD